MTSNAILSSKSYFLRWLLSTHTFSLKRLIWEWGSIGCTLPAAVGKELCATTPEERWFRSSTWFTLHLHLPSTSSRDQLSYWVQPKIWSLDWEPGQMNKTKHKREERRENEKIGEGEELHSVWKGRRKVLGKFNHKYKWPGKWYNRMGKTGFVTARGQKTQPD